MQITIKIEKPNLSKVTDLAKKGSSATVRGLKNAGQATKTTSIKVAQTTKDKVEDIKVMPKVRKHNKHVRANRGVTDVQQAFKVG